MVEYYREGALVGEEAPTDTRTQAELFEQNPVFPSLQPIHSFPSPERGDIGLAFSKGTRLLSGSAEVTYKGFTGELLKQLGLEEAGQNWLSDAYQSGILMGMDVNEIDAELKGPKNLGEIEDWKGAIAWGVNAVAEQVPNLVTTFAPAVIGTLILKRPTLGTVGTLGTIDFLNTAEVYTDLLMETGESRPAVAAATGALMSSLDMIVPMKIIGRMKKGPEFASWLGKKMKDPKSGIPLKIGKAISMGVTEGTTEYIQTMFEGMALNYVQEKDLLTEFSQAQQEEQLEAGARGALIGTLLGIPISYSGRSARKKAKNYSQNIIDKTQQGIVESNEALNAQDQIVLNSSNMPTGPIAGTAQGLLSLKQLTGGRTPQEVTTINELDFSLPQPESIDSIFEEEISQPEYNLYIRTGEIAPQRLYRIARKISKNQELNPIEFSVYDGNRSQVESILADIQNKDRQGKILKQSIARTKAGSIAAILNRDSVSNPELDMLSRLGDPLQIAQEQGKKNQLFRRMKGPRRLPAPAAPVDRSVPLTGPPVVERGKTGIRRVPTESTQDILSGLEYGAKGKETARTKMTALGWNVTGETLSINPTTRDEPAFEGDTDLKRTIKKTAAGPYDFTYVYETDNHILKKEDGLKKSRWEITDKKTGKVIDSAWGEGGMRVLSEKYESRPVDVVQKRQREDQEKEVAGISFEQALARQGRLEAGEKDTVRFYVRTPEGKWAYPNDETFTVKKIEHTSPEGITGQQFTVETPITTTYTLVPTKGGTEFKEIIGPMQDDIRIVPRLRAAWKYPQFFGEPVTEIDAQIEEAGEGLSTDLTDAELASLPKKDRDRIAGTITVDELQKYTDEGKKKETLQRISEFYDRLDNDPDFRSDVEDAITRVSLTRNALEATGTKTYRPFAKREAKIQIAFPVVTDNLNLLSKSSMEAVEEWIDNSLTVYIRKNELPSATKSIEEEKAATKDLQNVDVNKLVAKGEADRQSTDLEEGTDEAGPAQTAEEAEQKANEAGEVARITEEQYRDDVYVKKIYKSDESLYKVFGLEDAKVNKRRGTVKTAITKRIDRRQKGKVKLTKAPETERNYVELDALDIDTGERPTPDTTRVKVRESVAKEKGLEEGVFYPWEDIGTVPQWKTAKGDLSNAYLKVAGQLVLKTDIIGVEQRSTTKELRDSDFIEVVTPDTIPNPETVDKAFVDRKTGVTVIKRKKDEEVDFDPAMLSPISDVEVYITFTNKQEHEAKVDALKDSLMARATETAGKTRKIKRVVDTTKNKKFLTTDIAQSLRGGRVTAVVKPSVLSKVNKIRKQNLDKLRAQGRRYAVRIPSGFKPIKDSKFKFEVNQSTREGFVNIAALGSDNYGDNIITISADSVLEATQTSVVPELIGAMNSYEALVEAGPEKGSRLVASYNLSDGKGDLIQYNEFVDAVFGETAHRYGMFGADRERLQKARADSLSENIGNKAVFEMYDGSIISGTISSVDAGTSVSIQMPKDKAKPDPSVGKVVEGTYSNVIYVDLLNYQRVQVVRPKESIKVIEGAPIDDTGPPDSMLTYYPFKEETINVDRVPIFGSNASDNPTIVRVYYAKIKKTYTVNVDGVSDLTGAFAQEAADYLNDLEKRTVGELIVYKLPEGLKREEVIRVSGEGVPTDVRYTYSPGKEESDLGITVMPVADPVVEELSERQLTEVKRLRANRKSYKFIAEKLDISVDQVQSIVGVTKRDDLVAAMSDPEAAKKVADDPETKKAAVEINKVITEMSEDNRKKREDQAAPVVTKPVTTKDTKKKEVKPTKPVTTTDTEELFVGEERQTTDDAPTDPEQVVTKPITGDTPFVRMDVGQSFEDKHGGKWKVTEKVSNVAYVQFTGGKAPDLKFQVIVHGKKDVTKFSKGMTIEVDRMSTPNNMSVRISHDNFETDFENYSIVRPIPADGQGSFKYNTGLTPKRFKEVLGSTVGRLNLERLIKSGEVIIVQNQQDVPFNLINMAVHAVTRNGKTWFITNNIRESEITGLYLHEIGVHLGMKQVYGDDFNSVLNQVKSRRNNPEWADAFDAATVSANQKIFADDVARENYIAEEAFAYFVESNDDYKNSFWQIIFDALKRVAARFQMYIGKPVSDGQLIAFARGAARGMSQRNNQQTIDSDDEEYYSLVQGAADRILETEGGRKLHDAAERAGYTEKAGSAWRATKKFFDPFANLPFARDLRKLRSLLAGKMGEIELLGRDILKAYDNLTEEQNQELFEFFTTQGATFAETSTVDKQLQQASVGLKNKIEEIATEAELREMFPEASKEQLAELRGAYLPRVYLTNILAQSTDIGGKFRTTGKLWTMPRKQFDESVREMMGEIKDVKYLLYNALTMSQHDIVVIDYLEQLSVRSAIEESESLKKLNERLNQKMVDRDNTTTDEEKTSIDQDITNLKKQIKDMPKDERFVAGDVPWVMPKQWLEIKFINKDGTEGKRRTTLASLERQITAFNNLIVQGKSTMKPEAIEALKERSAELELARKEFYDSLGVPLDQLGANQEGDASSIAKYYDDNYDLKMFRRIPNIPDKYGSMAGLYVRREIYDDIIGNADMVKGEQNLFQRMLLPYGKHAKLVSAFKILKVPLNPPTVVRNFASNLVLMQLIGGVAFHRQPALLRAALKEMRGEDSGMVFTHSKTGKKFTAYELAQEQGVSGTTLTSAELKKMEIVFQHMEKEGVWGILTGGQKMWNKLAEFGGDLYQNIEILGKVAVIMDKLNNDTQRAELNNILAKENSKILTVEDIAVQEANRILFDYSEVSPTIRGLRSSFLGAPFITFQVKVLPELVKVLNDPSKYHRFLPYMMLIGSAQALFGSIPFMEDDWDKMEELLPEFTKDNTMLFLPWKDSEGRWQAVDISYFFPWSWYTQMATKLGQGDVSKALIEGGVIGPGWQLMAAITTNKDPWSGYDIVKEDDPLSDRIFDRISYMNSMMMPPLLTRNGLVSVSSIGEAMVRLDPTEVEGKLFDFMLGRTNRYGDVKTSAFKMIGSSVGLTSYAIPPDVISAQNKKYNSDIRGLKADRTSTKKNRSLTPKQRKRKVNEFTRRIDETREERAEFNRKTSGIERTL